MNKLNNLSKKTAGIGFDAENVFDEIFKIRQELYNLRHDYKFDYKDVSSRKWLFKIIDYLNECMDIAKIIQKKLYENNTK